MIAHMTLLGRSALLWTGISILLGAGCSDRFESRYRTLSEAQKNGAIERGWIPQGLPPSSTEITELHDLDTNWVWGALTFRRDDRISSSFFVEVPVQHIAGQRIRNPSRSWWPRVLTGTLEADALHRSGLRFYKQGGHFLAVDHASRRVFFGLLEGNLSNYRGMRSVLHIHWADAVALAEFSNPLHVIEGRQLSSVEFVQDYVQLRFDGPTLTAITHPTVRVSERCFAWGQSGYRDALCDRIGKIVRNASVVESQEIAIDFEDSSVIAISLKPIDYRAAEAATLGNLPQRVVSF